MYRPAPLRRVNMNGDRTQACVSRQFPHIAQPLAQRLGIQPGEMSGKADTEFIFNNVAAEKIITNSLMRQSVPQKAAWSESRQD